MCVYVCVPVCVCVCLCVCLCVPLCVSLAPRMILGDPWRSRGVPGPPRDSWDPPDPLGDPQESPGVLQGCSQGKTKENDEPAMVSSFYLYMYEYGDVYIYIYTYAYVYTCIYI